MDHETIKETTKSNKKSKEEQPKELKMEKITIQDLPGVGAATAEKLESAGYRDMMSIAVATIGELVETAGMSEAVARKMINAARDSMKMGFESGMDILKKRELVHKISTGAASFDTLMGGGFETNAITECFGEFGSGKTQVGHILAVNALKEDSEAYAVYLDTENTFRPERIIQLAEGAGVNPENILSRIMVARAYNSDHQMLLAEKVDGLVTEQQKKIRLVVVDSLTSHFRAEFIGRGTLAERQQKLNRHMHTLAKIASSHNICVYVTNQVMAKPDQFFGDPTASIGGHIVAHASTFRIYLRKGKKGSRVAKLIDAPNLADGECCFEVQQGGLIDIN
ncbi:DNA repair and recombination protein RadA [Candidatus Woesearchaeota archaeon CG_4_10_14_0_2_um_filter_33_13]|nr:MAG: DNA repair and recombination protein RadA [Candidatus Woesearchaeota archaeon CG_4_10_14_0_2_um_filter_33_13]